MDELLIDRAHLGHERKEQLAAILEVVGDRAAALGADGLDVEADEFTAAAVARFLEDADLVEGSAEVGTAEVFILVLF